MEEKKTGKTIEKKFEGEIGITSVEKQISLGFPELETNPTIIKKYLDGCDNKGTYNFPSGTRVKILSINYGKPPLNLARSFEDYLKMGKPKEFNVEITKRYTPVK